jgi:CRP-like cAMP-binding protein
MEGEVEVDLQPRPVRLGKGQFFGEIALLRDTVRTATVTTLTDCQLLQLDASDFRRLIERIPTLKDRIAETARRRLDAQSSEPPPRS